MTKRKILSQIATLFDPLGLIGPVIVLAKIIMQQLWQIDAAWDETVPDKTSNMWNEFRDQLQLLHQLRIPGKVIIQEATQLQLHGFCDASETSYGAYIYQRSTDTAGNCMIQLICAKSRVAPIKKVTLPRLELYAALLLSKLMDVSLKSLNIVFEKICLWSHSTITLY